MANSAPFYDVGLYQGRVVSQGLTKSGTGTPQFVLRVKILGTVESDGSYSPSKQQYERTIYMALTEKTMPFTVETLKILGFTGDKISQLDPSSPNHQTFVGNDYDLWCKWEPKQDGSGDRERWMVSKGVQAMDLTPLDTKASRQLDSLFGAALKGNKAQAKIAARRNAPEDENQEQESERDPHTGFDTGITDDDIPF